MARLQSASTEPSLVIWQRIYGAPYNFVTAVILLLQFGAQKYLALGEIYRGICTVLNWQSLAKRELSNQVIDSRKSMHYIPLTINITPEPPILIRLKT